MKTAIVYYSLEGNAKYMAEQIAAELDADLIELIPEKTYPDSGAKKYFWGGKSVVFGEKPALKPYIFDADNYDSLVFATPVWASNFTPPLRTFISENREKLSGKKLSLALCYMGGGAQKAEKKLKAFLGIEAFEAVLILVDPLKKKKDEDLEKIHAFCEKIR